MNTDTHMKLMLNTVLYYFESCKNDFKDDKKKTNKIYKYIWEIKRFNNLNKLTQKQSDIIISIGSDDFVKKEMKIQVSYYVYALEILKLLNEDSYGIARKLCTNKKKLSIGPLPEFAIEMIVIKKKEPEKYNSYKELFDNSIAAARRFYDYSKKRIYELENK